MGKLDGINISEAALKKRKLWTAAPGRRKDLTLVMEAIPTSNVQNANMWNTAYVKASKQKISTRNKGVMVVTPIRKCQNGSAFAETTGTDVMSIGIVSQ